MITHDESPQFVACPANIAVIGGGRWARVIIEVLCGFVPKSVRIGVYSLHNADAMAAWVSMRGFSQRIEVSSSFPKFHSGQSHAAIVVNAARDHEKAIEWALSQRVPVLVEKPMTLTFQASQRLADFAQSQGTYLAAAHVFLFARYIETFSKLIGASSDIRFIQLNWMDPKTELRYGENKSYDPGLTVFADWLPHVISILGALTNCREENVKKLVLYRGGAHLCLDLLLGDIPCTVQLVRNADLRQRLIDVTTLKQKKVSLDFTTEPGAITEDSITSSGDPYWSFSEKPVSRMLRAFLQGAVGGICDSRLDIENGLRASKIINQTSSLYYSALLPWLSNKFFDFDNSDCDFRYALSEIICAEALYSSMPLEQQIDFVCKYIQDYTKSSLNKDLLYSNPKGFIEMILRQCAHSTHI
ncbi:MAG: Gfo/Idh/MocA family oxidoreductase [Chlorobium sp.]